MIAVEQTRAPNTIGASDAAGALGLDPRNPPLSVWKRLRPRDVEEQVEAVVHEVDKVSVPLGNGSREQAWRWGHILEPIVREWYAQERSAVVAVPETSFMLDGWLRATPDGVVFDESPGGRTEAFDTAWFDLRYARGLLQVKTADSWLEHEWTDGPTARYEVQCRVEMAVCSLPWCDLVALVGGNRTYVHRIERDLNIEARIIADLRKFWDSAQAGIEPAVDGSDDWRAHIGRRMPASHATMTSTPETHEVIMALQKASREVEAAKARVSEARNHLLLHMSAAQVTAVQHEVLGRFTAYRAGGGMDWKGYAEALRRVLMDLAETNMIEVPAGTEFKRPSTTWSIRNPRGFKEEDDE